MQGAGGALASAVIFGMIVRLFPEPAAQARAMGVYSFTQAGGAAVGFVAGGVLTDAARLAGDLPGQRADRRRGLWSPAARLLPREPGLGLRAGPTCPARC